MTRHHQLKNEARRAEQRSDWARAIELYKSAVRLEEERGSGSDVGVYNRVGDLYLRQGDTASAVEYYEQAADRYAAHGLHTSAIALCNKILRIAPDRFEVYGRLARLHASTGLLAESRSAFLRFAERMRESDRLSDALETVQDLVSLTGDEELRAAFAEQLAEAGLSAQAVAQLRLVYQARLAGGRNTQDIREKIIELDPDADPLGGKSPPPPRAAPTSAPEVTDRHVSEDPPGLDLALPDLLSESLGPSSVGGNGDWGGATEGFGASDGGIESVLTRFRSQVNEIVEETDHAFHYDLGVAYMGMGLFDDAVRELRLAMHSPALLEPAQALLDECLRSRGESGSAESLEVESPEEDEHVLPLPAADDFMLGQSLDLGPPAESEDPGRETEEPRAISVSADEDELADMLFQARLAQHRVRAAGEEGRADHQAHLDLGRTYERMGLLSEAVRDLRSAVAGPPGVRKEALEALTRVVSSEMIDSEALREAMACLKEQGLEDVAAAAGREFTGRPGVREVDRQAVLAMLPPESPAAVREQKAASPARPAEGALAELGDILAGLDLEEGDDLDAEGLGAPTADSEAEVSTSTGVPIGEDAAALFGEAEGLRAAGRMDEAESHYYRALELFEKKRDSINAIRAVDRLLSLRPDDVVLHHQKNELAIMTNDRELLVSSYLDLAACLRRQNGLRSARTVYGRILDLDPRNAEARAGIAAVEADELARERQRQREPSRRGPDRDKQPSRGPGEFDAMFQDLKEEGEPEADAPTDYESHYELGIAFRQMEMWDEAAREFKLAGHGMGEPLKAYERLGECLVALRRYDEARRTLAVAVTQPGNDRDRAGVLFQLGVASLRSGDREAARSCLDRAVKFDPARSDAAQLLSTLPA